MARGILSIINFITAVIWAIVKMLIAAVTACRVFILLKPLAVGSAEILGEAGAKLSEAYQRVKEAEERGQG